jgi:hypothetical protein
MSSDARLMMIRHWHLRNGHKPRDGQDYCEGCAYEMDDLIKHMTEAGFVVVPATLLNKIPNEPPMLGKPQVTLEGSE